MTPTWFNARYFDEITPIPPYKLFCALVGQSQDVWLDEKIPGRLGTTSSLGLSLWRWFSVWLATYHRTPSTTTRTLKGLYIVTHISSPLRDNYTDKASTRVFRGTRTVFVSSMWSSHKIAALCSALIHRSPRMYCIYSTHQTFTNGFDQYNPNKIYITSAENL